MIDPPVGGDGRAMPLRPSVYAREREGFGMLKTLGEAHDRVGRGTHLSSRLTAASSGAASLPVASSGFRVQPMWSTSRYRRYVWPRSGESLAHSAAVGAAAGPTVAPPPPSATAARATTPWVRRGLLGMAIPGRASALGVYAAALPIDGLP